MDDSITIDKPNSNIVIMEKILFKRISMQCAVLKLGRSSCRLPHKLINPCPWPSEVM